MSYELTGKIEEIFDRVEINDRFTKREFVVVKEEAVGGKVYTEEIKFQLTQDRCDLIDSFQGGTDVKVSFNIKGRKWEKDGKISYFTSLEAWRIEAAASESQASQSSGGVIQDDNDDLPF